MSKYPLVNVIIPTYKRPDILTRAVDSVKNQTYPNIEIIVVDDANDVRVRTLYENDPDVTLLVNETNRGGCYSRNRGLSIAKGEYINFLDDDDILYPTKIEKQVLFFKENPNEVENLGMVTCHTNDGRSGKNIIRYNRFRGNIYKKLLLKFLISGIETVLYKSKVLKKVNGFDNDLVSNHEYDLQIRAGKKYSIDFVDEILTQEFISVDQISVNFDKKLKGAKQIYKKYKKAYNERGFIFSWIVFIKFQLLYVKFRIAKTLGARIYFKLLR